MSEKHFRLRGDQIREIAPGRGSCIASDEITVAGKAVGYMYHEGADDPNDSGWRFFSGSESQAFADDPENFALYDVNTIANYDIAILALLDAPPGTAFERNSVGEFVEVRFPADLPDA